MKYVDSTGESEVVGTDKKGNLLLGQNYKPVSAVINIVRPTNGYGDEFDSTVTVDVTMENGQTLSSGLSNVGANAKNRKHAADNKGTTLPDGDYSLTTEGEHMRPNSEGGHDSPSYHNVLRIQTDDPNIHGDTRKSVNSGMYLFHGTEYKNGITWDTPWSAGCISPPGDQAGQDKFMKSINDLSVPLDSITVRIRSEVNIWTGKPLMR